jgi:hypothetical protein
VNDAVDGRKMTAWYGVDPYRMPYRLKKVLEPDGTVTVAVIRVPLGRRYGHGVQPYESSFHQVHVKLHSVDPRAKATEYLVTD